MLSANGCLHSASIHGLQIFLHHTLDDHHDSDGCTGSRDAVSLRVVPNRLQFFEYESVTFHCEGVDYCEVVHKFKGKVESCSKTNKTTPTGSSCTIKNVYTDDSGAYWYETKGGTRSKIIKIRVTDGPVILESPAVPVLMEETVTLSCRNKTASSNFKSEFYKDGRLIHRSSTGSMIIQRVSESDEGLYKCNISGAGDSPETWLKVTANPDGHKDMCHSSSAATPWIVCTILFSALLVAVGLYCFGRCYWDRENEGVLPSRPLHYNYDMGDTQPQGTNTMMSSAGIYQPIAEDPFYSTIFGSS
ncbi:uncharacterized protein LOC121813384 isoform X2 [Haplochromis burtoni]|uniref:uncharacterized protein LOC121813384 isoform X2 n=1 Tax=Haplochromis burtoni TaxID=8153 RepID=UPI001C2DCABA|nr:uncharacterized protein LOC121813384 isoform X2 [Haplochromis burtoni]